MEPTAASADAQGWGQNGLYGPPYALLQGSLAGMTEQPPMEGTPAVKKGKYLLPWYN